MGIYRILGQGDVMLQRVFSSSNRIETEKLGLLENTENREVYLVFGLK